MIRQSPAARISVLLRRVVLNRIRAGYVLTRNPMNYAQLFRVRSRRTW